MLLLSSISSPMKPCDCPLNLTSDCVSNWRNQNSFLFYWLQLRAAANPTVPFRSFADERATDIAQTRQLIYNVTRTGAAAAISLSLWCWLDACYLSQKIKFMEVEHKSEPAFLVLRRFRKKRLFLQQIIPPTICATVSLSHPKGHKVWPLGAVNPPSSVVRSQPQSPAWCGTTKTSSMQSRTETILIFWVFFLLFSAWAWGKHLA